MDGICKLGDFGLVIDFAQTDGEDGKYNDSSAFNYVLHF